MFYVTQWDTQRRELDEAKARREAERQRQHG